MTDTPQSLPIEIKHRHSGTVLYRSTTALTREAALIEAVAAKVRLDYADLPSLRMPYGSDLRGSDLRGSYLSGSDLSGSYLSGSYLSGSDLRGSDLRGSDLRGSDLSGSDLRGSDLRGSYLRGSDLSGSYLRGSYLRGSYLSGSDETKIIIANGSKAAYAGPVGNSDRVVFGFIANPDEKHAEPWLVLVCGCFTGDEEGYLARVAQNYGKSGGDRATCVAALEHCKAVAATWTITVEKPAATENKGGAA